MNAKESRITRKLKTAAACIVLGLFVEAATLWWSHPTSFIVFASAGALLIALGILIYLTAIVRQ
jgi:apolipoprotein N-acyltransferase